MKKLLTVIALLVIAALPAIAQTIDYPAVENRDDRNTTIKKIETDSQYTIVSFETIASSDNSVVQLNKEIYLQTDASNVHYNYLKSENIAIVPAKQTLSNAGDKLVFKVYFKKIPPEAKFINITERAGPNNGKVSFFNFYNVSLTKSQLANTQFSTSSKGYTFGTGTAVVIDSVTIQAPTMRIGSSNMSSDITDAMKAMEPMMSKMATVMMDAQLNYYKQPGKMAEVAKLNKVYYDALRKEGFSSDDALKIITSDSIMPKPTALSTK